MSKELIANGSKTIIGMVHCLPLPGTLGFDGDFQKIIDHAVADAITLEKAGADAVCIENMGDAPFTAILETPQIVALTAAAVRVREAISIPMGVDAAFNDCETSISIAGMIGADFVRIPVFADTVIYTDGIISPCARKCMLFRKRMGLENVKILADVQVKHTYPLVYDIPIEYSAKDAAGCGADGIIVSGQTVGQETPIDLIKKVKNVVDIPVFAGSGINKNNIHEQLNIADGCIIGSSFKKGGILTNLIDYDLAREVISAL